MATVQYHQPGVCKVVNNQTIHPQHYWFITTPMGEQDELINQFDIYRYMAGTQGAALEVGLDGLLVASSALGVGLSGGGPDVIDVKISKQPSKTIDDSGKLLWEDTDGSTYYTTRADVAADAAGPYSLRGNNTGSARQSYDLTQINIPTAAGGPGTTLIGFNGNGQIVQIDASSGGVVNLTSTRDTLKVDIHTDTGGTSASIPLAEINGDAGLFSGVEKWGLDYLLNNQTTLQADHTPTDVTIQNNTGSDARIAYATTALAGVMTAADKQKLDSLTPGGGGPTDVDLSLRREVSTNTIDNTAGDGVTLLLADANYAGLFSPQEKSDLNDLVNKVVDLTYYQRPLDNLIDNSDGTSVVLLPVTDTVSGLMTPQMKSDLENAAAQDLGLTITAVDNQISITGGVGITLVPATDTDAGLMSAVDKQVLDSLSTSSTNLSTNYSPTWVEIDNTVGTNALINPADYLSNNAGVMSADDNRVIQNLYTGPSNALLVSWPTGEPTWVARAGFDQEPLLQTARLLGFTDTNKLCVFPAPTGGGGGTEKYIKMTAHTLVAGDIGKPIVEGHVWDDTATPWPTGALLEIFDADTVRVAQQNEMFEVVTALIEVGYDPVADGRWLSWDDSVGRYVSTLPSDSAAGITEFLEVLESSPSGYYAMWHDHGPLGAGTTTPGGGGTPGGDVEEVELVNGIPSGTPHVDRKVAADYANNDWYYSTGGSWAKLSDSITTAPQSTTQTVTNVKILECNFGSQTTVDTLAGGVEGDTLKILTLNGNMLLEPGANIKTPHSETWSPGQNGGAITLVLRNSVWYTLSAESYTPLTNIIAGTT